MAIFYVSYHESVCFYGPLYCSVCMSAYKRFGRKSNEISCHLVQFLCLYLNVHITDSVAIENFLIKYILYFLFFFTT